MHQIACQITFKSILNVKLTGVKKLYKINFQTRYYEKTNGIFACNYAYCRLYITKQKKWKKNCKLLLTGLN